MKVRFLPEGGFDKNGAFVEYQGEEPLESAEQYQREGFIAFTAVCKELSVCNHFALRDEVKGNEAERSSASIFLSGDAEIEDDLHGRWRLSFLGHEKVHERVRILLHQTSGREKVHFCGHYSERDMDSEGFDEFFVEAHLAEERFGLVLRQMSQPNAELHLRVNPAVFPNFYATWSPSNRDGRVIKFLRDVRDVENYNDIPADFNLADTKQKIRSEVGADPIYIYVRRPLREAGYKESSDPDQEDDDSDRKEILAPPCHAETKPGAPYVVQTTERLTARVTALLWVASAIGTLMLLQLVSGLI